MYGTGRNAASAAQLTLGLKFVWLYKYRDLNEDQPEAFERLESVLRDQAFWAARPDTLNDPKEFDWSCTYEPTSETAGLLARVLAAYWGIEAACALHEASTIVRAGRLESVVDSVKRPVIAQLRASGGLICFGDSPKNPILWKRYGGNGNGVAIGVDVGDALYGLQLRDVKYVPYKQVHVDEFLRASLDDFPATTLFEAAFLAKLETWAPEREVRFVSKRHSVRVRLNPSQIKSLILGRDLSPGAIERIHAIAARLPYGLELWRVEA